jgi:hypothetical protein
MEPLRLKEIFDVCALVRPRTMYEVLCAMTEEAGELATEVGIATSFSKKEKGEDGIVGEAVDVMLCAADMIWMSKPDITERELVLIIRRKLKKWGDSKS